MDERIFFIQQQTFAAKLYPKLITKSIKREEIAVGQPLKLFGVILKKRNMAKQSMGVGQWINQPIDFILDYRGKWR